MEIEAKTKYEGDLGIKVFRHPKNQTKWRKFVDAIKTIISKGKITYVTKDN